MTDTLSITRAWRAGLDTSALRHCLRSLLLLGLVAGPVQAATFPVNDIGDAGDATAGDGVCATAGAVCTLRAAIQETNALAGPDVITFAIIPNGPKTITPATALPIITGRVTIDGTTQGGWVSAPIVELNGAVTAGADGLNLQGGGSDGSTIRGLVINRFDASAIAVFSQNNVIAGNYMGTDLSGTLASPNGVGVFIGNSGNRVGGTVPADRNIISGNTTDGIQILGFANDVQGNYIGLDVNGAIDLGNNNQGVAIFQGGSNNTIGGSVAGARNVISGNNNDGILIADPSTTGNVVQGNRIGTNAAGTAAVANLRGIEITGGASANTIGGAGGAGNLISGNLAGITINGSANNTVAGNRIGTDVSGTLDLGNLQHGVEVIAGASNNVIGGAPGTGNVISGNDQYGVSVIGAGTSDNRVIGNIIGLDLNGDVDVGNAQMGVGVGQGATANTIGEAGAPNVISGNNQNGVFLVDAGTNDNRVQNNRIGVDITGALARPNGIDGVRLEAGGAATGNMIGGDELGNVISGNVESGIRVINQMASTLILGNLVGTDASGNAGIGNGQHGVHISGGSAGNTVGGPGGGQRNVLSGNGGQGVRIDGTSTNNNVVAANRIGTNAAGTAGIGNASGGIAITNAAANNTIGGPIGGNLIAFNTGGDGVNVAADAGTGNAILGNSIHTNTGLGIDLLNDGVTSNDLGDPDPGPNLLQNFPALSGAVSVGGNVHVAGSLNGAASTTYRVELFANSLAVADEGERFLGAVNVLTDASGNTPFGATFVASVSPGELITATATDPANNTSELSAPLAVVGHLLVTTTSDVVDAPSTATITALVGNPGPDGRISLREAILATNATAGTDTIGFGIPLADAGHLLLPERCDRGLADERPAHRARRLRDAVFAGDRRLRPRLSAGSDAQLVPDTAGIGLRHDQRRHHPRRHHPARLPRGRPGHRIELHVGGQRTGAADRQPRGARSADCASTAPLPAAASPSSSGGRRTTSSPGTSWARTWPARPRGPATSSASSSSATARTTTASGVPPPRTATSSRPIPSTASRSALRPGDTIANNFVQGNYIGTDVNGTADLGNTNQGIEVTSSAGEFITNTTIGGTAPGAGNVISGNGDAGVEIDGSGTTGTLVQGNKIGTNALGTAGIANAERRQHR